MEDGVTSRQLDVLRWVVDGCAPDRWEARDNYYKLAARALANRRLVKVTTIPPPWRVEATDAGRFYVANGRYPDGHTFSDIDLTPVQRHDVEQVTVAPRLRQDPPTRKRPDASTLLRLPSGARKDPAVAVLAANPHWLEPPKSLHSRVLRIVAYVVSEARSIGWSVEQVEHQPKDWHGWNYRSLPSRKLVIIDAARAPVPIYVKAFKGSDGLCLRVLAGRRYGSIRKIEDTKFTLVESKLDRLLDHIAAESLAEQRAEAHRAERQKEYEQRVREARLRKARVDVYAEWRDTLLGHRERWLEHRKTTEFVSELARHLERSDYTGDVRQAESYLAWAREYVSQSDPFPSMALPAGERPEITHSEWREAIADTRAHYF